MDKRIGWVQDLRQVCGSTSKSLCATDKKYANFQSQQNELDYGRSQLGVWRCPWISRVGVRIFLVVARNKSLETLNNDIEVLCVKQWGCEGSRHQGVSVVTCWMMELSSRCGMKQSTGLSKVLLFFLTGGWILQDLVSRGRYVQSWMTWRRGFGSRKRRWKAGGHFWYICEYERWRCYLRSKRKIRGLSQSSSIKRTQETDDIKEGHDVEEEFRLAIKSLVNERQRDAGITTNWTTIRAHKNSEPKRIRKDRSG